MSTAVRKRSTVSSDLAADIACKILREEITDDRVPRLKVASKVFNYNFQCGDVGNHTIDDNQAVLRMLLFAVEHAVLDLVVVSIPSDRLLMTNPSQVEGGFIERVVGHFTDNFFAQRSRGGREVKIAVPLSSLTCLGIFFLPQSHHTTEPCQIVHTSPNI